MIDLVLSLILRSVTFFFYKDLANSVLLQARKMAKIQHPLVQFDTLICALVLAEDHRFYSHHGVDSRAIFRAITITVLTRRMQGGSTITQQLTRVITGDFRRSLDRKFKELCLAASLNSRLGKQEQALAYLHMAYFGWHMNGWKQAAKRLDIKFPCSEKDAAAIIARLKYPEPHIVNPTQTLKIQRRQEHIVRLMVKNEKSSRTSNSI